MLTELIEDLQFILMLLTNVQSLVKYCSTDLFKKQKETNMNEFAILRLLPMLRHGLPDNV